MPPPSNRTQRSNASTTPRSNGTPTRHSTKTLPSRPVSSVSAIVNKVAASSETLEAAGQEQSTNDDQIAEDGTVLLVEYGDLILEIQHTHTTKQHTSTTETLAVRVHTHLLIMHSTYFARLLSPTTSFAEGALVTKQLAALKTQYSGFEQVPISELPRIKIDYIGQISQVTSIKPLMLDFLRLLQRMRSETGRLPGSKGLKMPIKNVANLAIVADRFGASDVVGHWVTHNMPHPGHPGTSTPAELNEEQVRMRLCIGVLLDLDTYVSTYSLQLILVGSSSWSLYAAEPSETDPMWLIIPRGVEEELRFRRTQILQTFGTLQSYMLTCYASKVRKCWLGYDSSPQCDSFQLGEFVKFLARNGLLDLRASILGTSSEEADSQQLDNEEYQGDIRSLLATFRKCPAYQLDSNHGHCGPKKDLMAGLDIITTNISNASICWRCWQNGAANHRWNSANRPLLFDRKTAGKLGMAALKANSSRCPKEADHAFVRDFFLAKDKGWENMLSARTSGEVGTRLSSQGWILKHPDLLLNGLQRTGA